MFIVTWIFDKLGFIPKPKENAFNEAVSAAWPFPEVSKDFEPRPKKKPVTKKRTTKKPAVIAKTTRTKKVK